MVETSNEKDGLSDVVERLDRVADLMALTLVRELEQDEQIRILSTVGYAPARIGAFLGIRANTVSANLSRARKQSTSGRRRRRPSGGD